MDPSLTEELEFLRAAWPDDEELSIRPVPLSRRGALQASLAACLAPNTAGEETAQFVRCELLIDVPWAYPAAAPHLSLGPSRGLSDAARGQLLQELEDVAAGLVESPALF